MNSFKKICSLFIFSTLVFIFSFSNSFAQSANQSGDFFGDFSIRIYCTFATLVPMDDNKLCQTDIFVKGGLPADKLFAKANNPQNATTTNLLNQTNSSTTNVTYVNPVTRVVNETRVIYIPATSTGSTGECKSKSK